MILEDGTFVTHKDIPQDVFSSATSANKIGARKTGATICFMCLFEGLRIPTVRQLNRKPNQLFGHLVRDFDPSFFSPQATNSLIDIYNRCVNGPVYTSVDPTLENVKTTLSNFKYGSSETRIIIHYLGYGCLSPSSQGRLYFCSQDMKKYLGTSIRKLTDLCSSPLLFIIDVNKAGNLETSITEVRNSGKDVIAFLSCDSKSNLPTGVDLPAGFFSSCILKPVDTAVLWHKLRFSCVFSGISFKDDKNFATVESFFYAITNAIAFSTFSVDIYELYFQNDPSLSLLSSGFLLASRIFWFFNIGPISTPPMPYTPNNPLWVFWDSFLDEYSMDISNVISIFISFFDLLRASYQESIFCDSLPLIGFFISLSHTRDKATQLLLQYIDGSDPDISSVLRSRVWKVILDEQDRTKSMLFILAKLIAMTKSKIIDRENGMKLFETGDSDTLRGSMLVMICTLIHIPYSTYNKLSRVCIEYAVPCAPYSCLLYGILSKRMGRARDSDASSVFMPMLKSTNRDIRIAAAFALGYTNDTSSIIYLLEMTKSEFWLERHEAIVAAVRICRNHARGRLHEILATISTHINDISIIVKNTVQGIVKSSEEPDIIDDSIFKMHIFDLFIKSISSPGYNERSQGRIFAFQEESENSIQK